jgi:hypothetical protein
VQYAPDAGDCPEGVRTSQAVLYAVEFLLFPSRIHVRPVVESVETVVEQLVEFIKTLSRCMQAIQAVRFHKEKKCFNASRGIS